MTGRLEETLAAIATVDAEAMRRAAERQAQLTKPPGSLGRLETLAIQLAGITGSDRPTLGRATVVVMVADHGVSAEGVSAYPASVTVAMVRNFLAGGAAINVIAQSVAADVMVVDMGTFDRAAPDDARLVERRIGQGTANLARGPAMARGDAAAAVEAGIEIAEQLIGGGPCILVAGEMGIGNTTSASAMIAALTGRPPAEVTGRGTGVDDRGLANKVRIIEAALRLHTPDPADPLGVLAALGGFEIGGLAGLALGAARHRTPLIVDGLISAAGALVAARVCPAVKGYLIAGHRSVEPGHQIALDALGLAPLLDLGLRLGEGTGAALAIPLVRAAAETLATMATFEEAQVAGRVDRHVGEGSTP
jgi:nicotinate-nucleotide--dimethylbenzimidazole phosphoribosyltransferase